MQKIVLLSNCSTQQFDKIYAIYEKSFPLSEQKSKEFFITLFEREDYSIFICQNQDEIEIYRGRESSLRRTESEMLIGTNLNAVDLLEDLRNSIGITPKLFPEINSGLTVKL